MPVPEKPQVVLNLTSRKIQRVNWPGYPTLFETAIYRIVQLVFLESATAWKLIVPVPSAAPVTPHEVPFLGWPIESIE